MLNNLFYIILTSFFTSLITLFFAFHKFSFEKKWEIKVQAYQKIINSLHDLKKAINFLYQDSMAYEHIEGYDNQHKEKEIKLQISKFNDAKELIERISDVEAIFLGDIAVNILKKVIFEFENIHKKICREDIEITDAYEEESIVVNQAIVEMHNWLIKNLQHHSFFFK